MRRPASASTASALLVTATLLAGWVSCAPPPETGRVLLLLSIDTLRADRHGAYGNPRGLTPALDRLAAESALFIHCMSPSSWTMPAMGTLATGLRPNEHGMVYWHLPLEDAVEVTLAELLGDAGVGAAFFGNPIPALEGLDRGFDTWETFEGDDAGAVDGAIEWIRATRGTDRFVWVHLLGPHAPYDPLPQTVRTDPSLPSRTVAYDAEVRTADLRVERLLAALGPRAGVVVTADHGETLEERPELAYDHGKFLFEELIRVPLLLRVPGTVPRPVSGTIQLSDVPATVCDFFGTELPAHATGRSLLDCAGGGPVPARERTFAFVVEDDPPRYRDQRWSVRTDDSKVVFNLDRDTARAWNLAVDPGERVDVAGEADRMITAARRRLDEQIAAAPTPRIPFERRFSRAELERLQSLGYLGGAP